MSLAKIGDHDRRIANMIRVGRIVSADYEAARVVVALGKNKTASLPWITERAGNNKVWNPPSVGEQVVVLAPSGNLSAGVVLSGGIFKNDFPANGSSENITRTDFQDGASIVYDKEAHSYTITLPTGSTATIAAGSKSLVVNSSGVTITGNLAVSGNISTASGNISAASGDVEAGTVSLQAHAHLGVQSGTGTSGGPVGGTGSSGGSGGGGVSPSSVALAIAFS